MDLLEKAKRQLIVLLEDNIEGDYIKLYGDKFSKILSYPKPLHP